MKEGLFGCLLNRKITLIFWEAVLVRGSGFSETEETGDRYFSHLPQLCLSTLAGGQVVVSSVSSVQLWWLGCSEQPWAHYFHRLVFSFSWENSGRRCLGLRGKYIFYFIRNGLAVFQSDGTICIITCNISESHYSTSPCLHLVLSVFSSSAFFVGMKWVIHGCFSFTVLWDSQCCTYFQPLCLSAHLYMSHLCEVSKYCTLFVRFVSLLPLLVVTLYIHMSVYALSQIYILNIFFLIYNFQHYITFTGSC